MSESTALAPIGAQAISFRSIDEVNSFAKAIANSAFVPTAFRNKPGDVMAAIMYGLERGLSPMTSLQNIAVINGKPSVYGDLLLGMCLSDPSCEYIKETDTEDIKRTGIAWCEAKRKGKQVVRRTFSREDAQKAGLAGKGVWAQYEARMLMMRARSWCLRDAFADRLLGLQAQEEAQDIINVTPEPIVLPQQEKVSAAPMTASAPSHDAGETDTAGALISNDAEAEKRETIIGAIELTLREAGLDDKARAQELKATLYRSFGTASWKAIKALPVAELGEGYAKLQQVLRDNDVPDFGPAHAPESTAEATQEPAGDTIVDTEVSGVADGGEVEPQDDDARASDAMIAELQLLAQQAGPSALDDLEGMIGGKRRQSFTVSQYRTVKKHLQQRKAQAGQGALV